MTSPALTTKAPPHNGDFVLFVGAELDSGEQMRAQCHERHDPHQRISARSAMPVGAAKVFSILLAIGDTLTRSVDSIDGQSSPLMLSRTAMRPDVRRRHEQPLQRRFAQAGSGFHHRARRDWIFAR
jgi:hypothetical protein